MQISRLFGITSNILLNNSLQTVSIKGSNSSLGEFASGTINASLIPTINSNTGMFVIILDENLNRLDTKQYTLSANATTGKKDVDFMNYIGTLQPRRYFILVSNGSIGRSNNVDNFFSEYLGGELWGVMWDDYNTLQGVTQTSGTVSYAAFGSTELGITHESFSIDKTAELVVTIGKYDDFGITGYGLPLVELNAESYNSTYTNVDIPINSNTRGIFINARYKNAVSADDIVIDKTYTDNTTTTESLNTIVGDIFKNSTLNTKIESDVDTVTIRIRNVDISHCEIVKSNYGEITNPVSSISKRGRGFSVSNMSFSMNGYDFENDNHLVNFASASNIFSSMTSSSIVNNTSMPSRIISDNIQSDIIEVSSNQDYFVGFFSKNQTSNNTIVTVSVHCFDSDMNPLETIPLKNQIPNFIINLGEYSHINSDPVYQEYYILSHKQSFDDISNVEFLMSGVHGNSQNGGLSATTNTISDICVMIPNVTYFKFEFTTNNAVEIISPVCEPIRYSITKYSKYLGNVTEG